MRHLRARLSATLGELDAAETEVGSGWAADRTLSGVEVLASPAEVRRAAAGDTAAAVGDGVPQQRVLRLHGRVEFDHLVLNLNLTFGLPVKNAVRRPVAQAPRVAQVSMAGAQVRRACRVL